MEIDDDYKDNLIFIKEEPLTDSSLLQSQDLVSDDGSFLSLENSSSENRKCSNAKSLKNECTASRKKNPHLLLEAENNFMEVKKVRRMEGFRRGSVMFVDASNYVYKVNRKVPSGMFMRCHTKWCKAKGKIECRSNKSYDQETSALLGTTAHIQVTCEHNHSPDHNFVKTCQFLCRVKSRAESEDGSLRDFYKQEANRFSDIRLPSFLNLESTLQRHRKRRKEGGFPPSPFPPPHSLSPPHSPPLPPSVEEQCVAWAQSERSWVRGEPFFRSVVTSRDGKGHLLFLSPGVLARDLRKTPMLAVDTTVAGLPAGYLQMLTVHVHVERYTFSCAYVLMQSTSESSYLSVLEALSLLVGGPGGPDDTLAPSVVVTDFEEGLVGALRKVLPHAVLTTSWFHYCQSVCRKARSLGLLQPSSDAGQSHPHPHERMLRMCLALPLLPEDQIRGGLCHAVSQTAGSESSKPVCELKEFISGRWLDRVGTTHVSAFGRCLRLSHCVEAFHRRLHFALQPGTQADLDALLDVLISVDASCFERRRRLGRKRSLEEPLAGGGRDEFDVQLLAYNASLENGSLTVPQFLDLLSHRTPDLETCSPDCCSPPQTLLSSVSNNSLSISKIPL